METMRRHPDTGYFEEVRGKLNGSMLKIEESLLYDPRNANMITNMLLIKLIDEVRAVRQVLNQVGKQDV